MSRANPQDGSLWAPILLYHRTVPVPPARDPFGIFVSTQLFESQLRWLARRGYVSMPLSALDGALHGGDSPRLPPRSIVITLEDGYRDNYRYAWPILKRYGFTATIFLVADAIGGDNGFDTAFGSEPAPMLSTSEIREMHAQGIDFGKHSCWHPDSLVDLPDEQLRVELERSRSVIEEVIQGPSAISLIPTAGTTVEWRRRSNARATASRARAWGRASRRSAWAGSRRRAPAGRGWRPRRGGGG